MDPVLVARLSPSHRQRLAWFEDHEGEISGIPGPLKDGQLLVSKPKGIYKPADLPYALSIRINLDSPYRDGVPEPTAGAVGCCRTTRKTQIQPTGTRSSPIAG